MSDITITITETEAALLAEVLRLAQYRRLGAVLLRLQTRLRELDRERALRQQYGLDQTPATASLRPTIPVPPYEPITGRHGPTR